MYFHINLTTVPVFWQVSIAFLTHPNYCILQGFNTSSFGEESYIEREKKVVTSENKQTKIIQEAFFKKKLYL